MNVGIVALLLLVLLRNFFCKYSVISISDDSNFPNLINNNNNKSNAQR